MLGLDPEVAVHRFTVQDDFVPVKQEQRKCRHEVLTKIEAVEKSNIPHGSLALYLSKRKMVKLEYVKQ